MENYLFFRKIRPKVFKYTVTGTDVSNWANAPQGSATTFIVPPDPILGSADLKANETAKIEIKSAGSNSNIGSSYGSSVSAGDVTTLTAVTLFTTPTSNKITFKEASGSGSPDTTYGYTCIAGDELTIYFGDGEENWVAYPVSRFIGVSLADETTGLVHFKSLKGDANDDIVQFRYNTGMYQTFCKMINDACNYKAGKEGSFVTVFDGAGGEIKYLGNSSEYADLGVDRVDIVIESGY